MLAGQTVPEQVRAIIAWGWEKHLSSVFQTTSPLRGMPQYRVVLTDQHTRDQRSLTTNDPAHYEAGVLIRLIDQAYRETGWGITHLVWLKKKNKILIWYNQRGIPKYVSFIDRDHPQV